MTAQQLKNSILQMAVQGKLVEQNPDDEPASVLLERIKAEKQELIKTGKIKKGKPLPEITEDEIPFDIPDSWEWVRLNYVCEIARGGSPRPIKQFLTDDPNGINWIKIGDSDKGGKYINETQERIIPEGMSKSRFVHKGDFLLTNSMSFGRPYILNVDGCIHDGWLVLSGYDMAYDKDFLFYLLSSKFAYYQFCGVVSGAVVKNLNSDKVASAIFPLPPFAEQQRIVKKIEELLPYIEKYGTAETKLTALNTTFPEALKKSILQEAVQGKLVPQNPDDEPASVLLERIRAEKQALIKTGKIKKEKPLPEITEDEIPFDIPDSWEWVRLRSIVYNRGQMKPTSNFCYVDIGSIDNENQKLGDTENIITPDKAPSRARKIIDIGDIIYSTVRPYLHNMCIIDKQFSLQPIASTGFATMTCYNGLFNKYLFYYLLSPDFDNYANDTENSKGVAYPAINDDRLYKALIPIPPLAEQHRIVSKIEELMPIISTISK